ncbi:heterokaryon incompatibility protein-domain-containing protein [Xylariaceae sp. FL0255]|nr:heterokaryon incompatibility protein-domain-containing protein [Xylariaceae sp. FL0255]
MQLTHLTSLAVAAFTAGAIAANIDERDIVTLTKTQFLDGHEIVRTFTVDVPDAAAPTAIAERNVVTLTETQYLDGHDIVRTFTVTVPDSATATVAGVNIVRDAEPTGLANEEPHHSSHHPHGPPPPDHSSSTHHPHHSHHPNPIRMRQGDEDIIPNTFRTDVRTKRELEFDPERFPDTSPPRLNVGLTIPFTDWNGELQAHPFQEYHALSYVWDDPNDTEIIQLDNTPHRVTRNLYTALCSLLSEIDVRKLWIDSLCINQQSDAEKEVHLSLMGRIYEQARKVISYIPLPLADEKNIICLVGDIISAQGKSIEKYGKAQDVTRFEVQRASAYEPFSLACEGLTSRPDSEWIAPHKENDQESA